MINIELSIMSCIEECTIGGRADLDCDPASGVRFRLEAMAASYSLVAVHREKRPRWATAKIAEILEQIVPTVLLSSNRLHPVM